MGSPVWKWKSCKNMRRKGAEQAANGPVWLPKALKTFCLIQFLGWKNSLFPLLALWGNKNWPTNMKVKKAQKYLSKCGWTGCKWSSWSPPGTQSPLCHLLLKFLIFCACKTQSALCVAVRRSRINASREETSTEVYFLVKYNLSFMRLG